eukprot:2171678-Pyramimonas_sp.AAC.1
MDAVARAMMHAEAFSQHATKAVATTLVDISKCFGRICWRRVLQAAEHFDFPTQILQLCLATYDAPRRMKWNSIFSYACQAHRG